MARSTDGPATRHGGKGKVPRPEPTAIRLQSSNCPTKGWRHVPPRRAHRGTDSAFPSLEAVPEMLAWGAAVDPPGTSGRPMGWSGSNGPLGQVVSSAPGTGRGTGGSGHPTNGRGLGRWRSVPFRIVQRPRIGLLPQPLSGVIRAQTGSNARVPASPRCSFLFAVFPAHTRRFQPPSAASPVRRNPVCGRPRPLGGR